MYFLMEGVENTLVRLRAIAKANGGPTRSQTLGQAISIFEQIHLGVENLQGDWLFTILAEIIKPLFARTANPNLTPSGRKNLVAPPPTKRLSPSDFLDSDTKPWKQAPWCLDILKFVIAQYQASLTIPERPLTDSNFFLLVPPMLALIDDGEIFYKAIGCELLNDLCKAISGCRSSILSRTGLADIFADSLKTSFMLLPTLTPEDESLALHQQLYPAFRALVNATYPEDLYRSTTATPNPAPSSKSGDDIQSDLSASFQPLALQDKWNSPRQKMLDTIFRNGILASYNHCSTSHIRMSTFFIQQATLTVPLMHINATKYLINILPMLRRTLTNPLAAAYPPLLSAVLTLLQTLIEQCKERIAMNWWYECLRMLVGCWIIVQTDLPDTKGDKLRRQMRQMVQILADLVGKDDFDENTKALLETGLDFGDLLSGPRHSPPKSRGNGIEELSDGET